MNLPDMRASGPSGAPSPPVSLGTEVNELVRVRRRPASDEKPLREDIRLLGRILGDVIREQEGVETFELVERIRKMSVAFRRDADQGADRALKSLLKSLSGEQAVRVIRAFTYFSHLANLAEDRHHIRRRQVHERAGDTQEGSIDVALARLRWAGVGLRAVSQALANSYVSPVLTAHPTEVQRKSILDAERDLARLLSLRDEIKALAQPRDVLAPRELAMNEAHMRARVLQLWQTRLLRYTKLTVADEVETSLSYYEATFLREIPKLYAQLEDELGAHPVASFLRMGQWIGGDRDGNPNVGAQTLEYALRRQCEVALRYYLTELFWMGREFSMSAMLVQVTPAMQALSDASPDRGEHRLDEPYRRALTGMYARLAATLKDFTGGDAARHAVPPQNPYLRVEDFLVELRAVRDSLLAHHAAAIGTAAAAATDSRRGGVRLPLGHHRLAPELRAARGVGGGVAEGGARRSRLQRARRSGQA
jgi:phosphoenolpyruvate carboxylase